MKIGYKKPRKVTDHMYLIPGKNQGRFPYSHSILILDEETVLIDTGCGIETLKQLRREYDIGIIVNSHTHPDHSAGNWLFHHRPIYVPEEGFDTSGNVSALSERFVNSRLAHSWRDYIKRLTGFRDCKPTDSYNKQLVFSFGKITLEPVHTPGHTRDHYSFYERKEGILLSFDYDFLFPWYGHEESSISEFRQSLRNLEALSPKLIVSSHKGIISRNIGANFAKFARTIDERDEKILSLLNKERTVDELVEHIPIYGKFPPYAEVPQARPILRYWERKMIEKHLEQLMNQRKVRQSGASRYIKRVRAH